MDAELIPFAKPSISDKSINEVVECLRSGWLATGPRVKQFEEALKKYLHAPHMLALMSATAGLHLALLSLKLQPGDEVITSAHTFVASANTIVLAGGKPVFVDIERNTYNMDVRKIESAITSRTKAIMPVHFAGLPVDLDAIYNIAEKHNLRVIEDAAQAIGAKYKDKMIGSFGDTQVFSFHPNKNLTTGEGGAIATQDEALAHFCKILSFHGIDKDAASYNSKSATSSLYDVNLPGFKYNMTDIQAAIGIHQLDELELSTKFRTELAQSYQEILKDVPQLTLPRRPTYTHRHVWHLYTPLLNLKEIKMTREEFIQKMREYNINIGIHYQAPHLFSFYRKRYGYKPGDYPIAEDVANRIISLPIFPDLSIPQQDRVIEALIKVLRN